jgi:hypothetical protein
MRGRIASPRPSLMRCMTRTGCIAHGNGRGPLARQIQPGMGMGRDSSLPILSYFRPKLSMASLARMVRTAMAVRTVAAAKAPVAL